MIINQSWILLAIIALIVLICGCTEQANSTITPVPSATPVQATPTPMPGPSMLFTMDNISWYQYYVNVPMEDFPRHLNLNVTYENTTYSYSNSSGRFDIPIKRTTIDLVWLNEDNRSRITYDVSRSTMQPIRINYGPGMMSGQHFGTIEDLLVLSGNRLPEAPDIDTRFNESTDKIMKIVGRETAKHGGELYECTVYEMAAGNDTFQVWSNATIPLPLKIEASYEDPVRYISHPSRVKISGPCTYELIGWG